MTEQAEKAAVTIQDHLAAAKLDPETSETGDLVLYLQEKHKGTFHRAVNPDKTHRVFLEFESGDRVSAHGETIPDAIAALATRLETHNA